MIIHCNCAFCRSHPAEAAYFKLNHNKLEVYSCGTYHRFELTKPDEQVIARFLLEEE